MTNETESGVIFWNSNTTPAAPVAGTEAMVKFMDGKGQMKPFVLLAEHPEGAQVKPHKHPYGRLEYILEGEIEFFEGQDARDFGRGKPVTGHRHGPGEISYVPANTLYAYRITKASKLLHIHEANPGGAGREAGTVVEADA
jgi:quercetin dioxygenase-like cupin family protein